MITADTQADFQKRIFIEKAYQERLAAIARQIEKIIKTTRPELLIQKLSQYSQSLFGYASNAAHTLIYNLNKQSIEQWQKQGQKINKLLQKELRSKRISELMNVYVDQNISLIRSLPLDAAKKTYKVLMEGHVSGARFESLVDKIQRIGQTTNSRATLIARTETSKISTALTQARSEVLGLNWYVWRTSQDVRVRDSHFGMSRVIINWKEPPAPEQLKNIKSKLGHYHAGNAPNCRCYAEPLISISEDVKWPCKVHYGGKLITMTRTQFEKIAA